jgi:hypothetical protein
MGKKHLAENGVTNQKIFNGSVPPPSIEELTIGLEKEKQYSEKLDNEILQWREFVSEIVTNKFVDIFAHIPANINLLRFINGEIDTLAHNILFSGLDFD